MDLLGLGLDANSESNNSEINNISNSVKNKFSDLDDLFQTGAGGASSNVNNADLLFDPFGSQNAQTSSAAEVKNFFVIFFFFPNIKLK